MLSKYHSHREAEDVVLAAALELFAYLWSTNVFRCIGEPKVIYKIKENIVYLHTETNLPIVAFFLKHFHKVVICEMFEQLFVMCSEDELCPWTRKNAHSVSVLLYEFVPEQYRYLQALCL